MMEAAADEEAAPGPGNGYLWMEEEGTDVSEVSARKLWFEITSFCLQWRKTYKAPQLEEDRLLYNEITQVAPLGTSKLRLKSAKSVKSDSKTVVLKATSPTERNSWLQSLGDAVFCSGRPPGADPMDIVKDCMQNGDVAYLRHILTTNASLVSALDEDGSTLVLKACKTQAQFEIVQALLLHGVDPTVLNYEQESPLLMAAATGNLDVLRLLIETGNVEIDQICASGITAVHAAASTGQLTCLQMLVDYGANIYAVDERGWSVLHYAASCGSCIDAVVWLCQQAPSLVTWPAHHDGNTPLHVAAHFGLSENAAVLVEYGASITAENHELQSPLQLAQAKGFYEVIHVLTSVSSYAEGSETFYHESSGWNGADELTNHNHTDSCDPSYGPSIYDPAWVECYTEEGHLYYYNSNTGESSWDPPLLQSEFPPEHPHDINQLTTSTTTATTNIATNGPLPSPPDNSTVPLCLIPTICPLYELDNPHVATKESLRRKKEREQRRNRCKSIKK